MVVVGGLRCVAPSEQAMVGQHYAFDGGVLAHQLSHHLGKPEAGPDVRGDGDAVAVDVPQDIVGRRCVGEGDYRVGMGVGHHCGGDKGVQQRLDGWPVGPRVESAVLQVGHHLLVGHGVQLEQGLNVVQTQAHEVLWPSGLEVRATALDEQSPGVAPAEVGLGGLDGGIAAAPYYESGVGPDEMTQVYKQVQPLKAARLILRPARVHWSLCPLSQSVSVGLSLEGLEQLVGLASAGPFMHDLPDGPNHRYRMFVLPDVAA